MLLELLRKNRSYRRFDHSYKIPQETLKDLVSLARLTPSPGNLQPLKYLLVYEEGATARLFGFLKWARYLRDWTGPSDTEGPSAYIVLLGDTTIAQSFQYDAGIAAQTMMLGATEKGLGGCILTSVDRDALRGAFCIPFHLEILLVMAIGKPVEQVVLEGLQPDGSIKYYRTPDGVHHVPKRSLDQLIVSFR
ncbi:nitroreductase family protein [bacterium]|nr:MAG: nitroreductase family protein [bacterium]